MIKQTYTKEKLINEINRIKSNKEYVNTDYHICLKKNDITKLENFIKNNISEIFLYEKRKDNCIDDELDSWNGKMLIWQVLYNNIIINISKIIDITINDDGYNEINNDSFVDEHASLSLQYLKNDLSVDVNKKTILDNLSFLEPVFFDYDNLPGDKCILFMESTRIN